MSKDTYNEYFTDVSQGGTYFQLTFYTNEKEKFLAMETLARKCIDADLDVEVVEVRHGYWKDDNRVSHSAKFRCSLCDGLAYYPQPTRDKAWKRCCPYKYCPNCSAKMDGERREK